MKVKMERSKGVTASRISGKEKHVKENMYIYIKKVNFQHYVYIHYRINQVINFTSC